ncbi:MAG: ABC transporter permease [Lachnospiraceae bacterium]|nr:ABC transporter permease [Lachnospiraceae bacterium]
MKNFKTIFKFELDNYFKSKSYMLLTIIIALIAATLMFIPRIVDSVKGEDDTKDSGVESEVNEEDLRNMAIYNPEGLGDMEMLAGYFSDAKFTECTSAEEVKKLVEDEKAEGGFVIKSSTEFDFYVFNKSMDNDDMEVFTEYMRMVVKMEYCEANNLNLEEYLAVEYAEINVNENILGKDGMQNYWYCYILVILVFMVIIAYGTTIASGITNEKSNRSIEILVTSTSTTALLFGKVLAGVVAAVFQFGLIGAASIGSYQINKDYLPNMLGMFLDIPGEVLLTFAIFGIGGFLFYAFLYGALGALVSKIEDLNKTAGSAQMIIMIVYMVTLFGIMDPDSILMKICSYLPISSYSAMFARVAMGSVAMWEIVLSAVLLYASVIGMGILGGKIFRNSTLRYGNPIKLSNALKNLKKED